VESAKSASDSTQELAYNTKRRTSNGASVHVQPEEVQGGKWSGVDGKFPPSAQTGSHEWKEQTGDNKTFRT